MGKKRSRGGAAAAASDDDGGDGVPEIDVPDHGRKGPKPCSAVSQSTHLMEMIKHKVGREDCPPDIIRNALVCAIILLQCVMSDDVVAKVTSAPALAALDTFFTELGQVLIKIAGHDVAFFALLSTALFSAPSGLGKLQNILAIELTGDDAALSLHDAKAFLHVHFVGEAVVPPSIERAGSTLDALERKVTEVDCDLKSIKIEQAEVLNKLNAIYDQNKVSARAISPDII